MPDARCPMPDARCPMKVRLVGNLDGAPTRERQARQQPKAETESGTGIDDGALTR